MKADRQSFNIVLQVALLLLVLISWLVLFRVKQPDYALFLLPWLTAIRESEGLSVFATGFTNYTAGYVTLLWVAERLDMLGGGWLGDMAVIKLAALACSLLCAGGVWAVLRALNWSKMPAFSAALGFLLLPETLTNGVAWGQADALYAAFLAFTLAAIIRERPLLACALFAAAIAVKLQAIWLAPFMAGWLLRRPRMIVPAIIAVPTAYLAINMLYIVAGRPVSDVAMIYFGQLGHFQRLSMNAPNLWLLVERLHPSASRADLYPLLMMIGVALAFAASLWIMWKVYRLANESAQMLLYWATVSSLLIPYLLPKMHERFFFMSGVLAYLLALIDRRYWPVAVLLQLAALFSYSQYHDMFRLGAIVAKPMAGPIAVVFMTIALWRLLKVRPVA